MELNKKNWHCYLTRPFSLFGSSVWNYWYTSDQILKLLGTKMTEGLFVEVHPNFIRCYRTKEELGKLLEGIGSIARDKEKTRKILEKGVELNKQALSKLDNKQFLSLKEELDFSVEVALCTALTPYWVYDFFTDKDSDIKKLCESLRAESLYQRLVKEILVPLGQKRLKELGVEDLSSVQLVTVSELLSGKVDCIDERKKKKQENMFFVYQDINNDEIVEWTNNPGDIVKELEHIETKDSQIKGTVAYKGNVKGRARLILQDTLKGLEFDKGDVLVSTSTDPQLTPIMHKASAIVTDEGGMGCHAAIIARELHKPCIIGTRIATSVIQDGDMVEVDADKGFVRVLDT